MKKPSKPQRAKRSEQDKLDDQCVAAAATAVLDRLKTWVGEVHNRDRKIRDLKMEHLELVAGDAVTAFLKKRTQLELSNPDQFTWADRHPELDPELNDPIPEHLLS